MPSNLSEKASIMMQEQKGSCSQAIFSTYGEHWGLGKVDSEIGMKIASAFSGGVARRGHICGALSGALMALGLKFGDDYNKVNEISVRLLDDFKTINGSIICRELINHDLITAEDLKKAFDTGAFKNCSKFVEDVSVILDEYL